MDHDRIITALLDMHWKQGYPIVAECIRGYLTDNSDLTLTTKEICDVLLPPLGAGGRGRGNDASARLIRKLDAIAEHAASDCATKSTHAKHRYGKLAYGWIWQAPGKPLPRVETPKEDEPMPIKIARPVLMRLTDARTRKRTIVRTTFVNSYEPCEPGTTLHFSDGHELHVCEEMPTIERLLIEMGSIDPEETINPEDI